MSILSSDEIKELNEQINKLFKEISYKQEKIKEINLKKRELIDKMADAWLKDMVEPDWENLFKENQKCNKVSRFLRNKAEERFAITIDSYWSDTQESCIRIPMFTKEEKEEKLEKIVSGIKTFAPFLTPHSDGKLWFSVANGYALHTTCDLSKVEVLSIWGNPKHLVTFYSLEEALTHILNTYWYPI